MLSLTVLILASPPNADLEEAQRLVDRAEELAGELEYDHAFELMERVIELKARALGPHHKEIVKHLFDMAVVADEMAEDLERSESNWRRTLETDALSRPANPDRLGAIASRLGWVLARNGNPKEARPILEQALQKQQEVLGAVHPETVGTLQRLASVTRGLGDYPAARRHGERVVEILAQEAGPGRPTADALSELGLTHFAMWDYEAAIRYHQAALDMLKAATEPDESRMSGEVFSLAVTRHVQGRIPEARRLHQQALAMRTPPEGDVMVGELPFSIVAASLAAADDGDVPAAIALLERRQRTENRSLQSLQMSMREMRFAAQKAQLSMLAAVSLAVRHPDASALTRFSLESVWSRLGRSAFTMASRRRRNAARLRGRSIKMKNLLAENARAQRAIADRVNASGFSLESAAEQEAFTKLLDELGDSERFGFIMGKAAPPPGLADVLPTIPAGSTLLQFVNYCQIGFDARCGAGRYAAYVVTSRRIRVVDLGDQRRIDTAVSTLVAGLSTPEPLDRVRRYARALDELVFAPVRDVLGRGTRLIVVPNGDLALVPFAALLDREGRWAAERFEISYVNIPAELADWSTPRPRPGASLVVAGPQCPPEIPCTPLPGALAEGKAVAQRLSTTPITGARAMRDVLHGHDKPTILHVAAHGIYGSGQRKGRTSTASLYTDFAMYRSGLLLSDGLMSAAELSSLDLTKTQAVVLSACESGVGDVHAGEGIFGLRRALSVAGAQTQVVSLWKVADEPTRQLMTSWYDQVLDGRSRPAAAMRKIQLAAIRGKALPATRQVLRTTRGFHKRAAPPPPAAHPYYWAPFIVSGRPDPLRM